MTRVWAFFYWLRFCNHGWECDVCGQIFFADIALPPVACPYCGTAA